MKKSMLTPGVSYLDAFLKNNSDLSLPYMVSSCIQKRKTVNYSENIIDIGKIKTLKECQMCSHPYEHDEDYSATIYYKITNKRSIETQSFQRTYTEKKKHEDFICRMCSKSLISCNNCGNKFEQYYITTAYDDTSLKKQVYVCLECYRYESCAGCGYLAGESPCSWCRSDM